MGIETEKKYLLKAISAFKRRFVVVTPEFKILAANCRMNGLCDSETIGKHCHQVFYDRSSPCENCAVKESIEKRKPTLMPKPENTLDLNEMPCFFAYPIYSGDAMSVWILIFPPEEDWKKNCNVPMPFCETSFSALLMV